MLKCTLALVMLALVWPAMGQDEVKPKQPAKKLISIAVLTQAPRKMTADEVRPKLSKRFKLQFGKTPDADNLIAQFRPNMIGIQFEGQRFAILSGDKPYSSKDAAWLETGDPRITRPFKQHNAWFAVDWFPEDDDKDEAKAYQRIGQIVAELLADDCLLLFAPAKNQLVWIHEGTRQALESDDPLAAMRWPDPEIIHVADNDPRMKAAVATARKRWPEFVKRFAARKPGEVMSVKKRFEDENGSEYMWVAVESITDGIAKGKLNNRPATVKNIKLGDEASVTPDELNDWLYLDGETKVGGFTIEVLRKAQSDAVKESAKPSPATRPSRP